MIEKVYLTPAEVAKRWRIATGTLANWRSAKTGPPYVRVPSGRILYIEHEVDEWVLSSRNTPEAEPASA